MGHEPTPAGYEAFRQELEQQFRADVELLYTAYQTRLRAFQAVVQLQGSFATGALPVPRLTELLRLPAADPVPAGTPAPAAPSRPVRRKAWELCQAIVAILDRLPDEFESKDVRVLLAWQPHKASLARALQVLCEEGVLERLPEVDYSRRVSYRRSSGSVAQSGSGES